MHRSWIGQAHGIEVSKSPESLLIHKLFTAGHAQEADESAICDFQGIETQESHDKNSFLVKQKYFACTEKR